MEEIKMYAKEAALWRGRYRKYMDNRTYTRTASNYRSRWRRALDKFNDAIDTYEDLNNCIISRRIEDYLE